MQQLLVLIMLLLVGCASMRNVEIPVPHTHVRPTATWTIVSVKDVLEPAPRLLQPQDGTAHQPGDGLKLSWAWVRSLRQGELYEVRIAPEGGVFNRVGFSQTAVFNATGWFAVRPPGVYQWSVRVIRQRPENNMEQRISIESEPFAIELAD